MPAKCFQSYIIFNNHQNLSKNTMKKLLFISTLCFTFLNTQIVATSSWTSINPKRINDAIAVASGMLSIPCFKMSYDLCQESTSVLRSILPNYNGLMITFEAECDRYISHGNPGMTYARLWNKFLKTNVEPLHPELFARLKSLNIKATALCFTGTLLASVALFCVLDNYVPKKTARVNPEIN